MGPREPELAISTCGITFPCPTSARQAGAPRPPACQTVSVGVSPSSAEHNGVRRPADRRWPTFTPTRDEGKLGLLHLGEWAWASHKPSKDNGDDPCRWRPTRSIEGGPPSRGFRGQGDWVACHRRGIRSAAGLESGSRPRAGDLYGVREVDGPGPGSRRPLADGY